MAIKKQFLKTKPVCKVTFKVDAETAETVSVAGDWNKWNSKKAPLKKLKNGSFTGTVNFLQGKNYEFKYVVDGNWQNEPEADKLVWNSYAGSENSVLEL